MKILLLSLVLVAVCDAQLPVFSEFSQLAGQWKTMYMAASNLEKLSENSPFRGYMRDIAVDIPRRTMHFKFFIKVNGECTEKSVVGTVRLNNMINVDYEGTNNFQVVKIAPTFMLGYDVNVDAEGRTTYFVLLIGRPHHVGEEAFEKFKELVRQKNIPEENIVKLIGTDDCPNN
ncbi:odorant-binding protein-like [Meles meles]|uniref:odorant-binding protein-like n=1 Tax=Meles meles TaxID=9662 RepID=UPI001E69ABF1|nr:odorant-binding protein-like [Meles meles]XP_045852754.1 odorant-binding protein-like [Meles meles]